MLQRLGGRSEHSRAPEDPMSAAYALTERSARTTSAEWSQYPAIPNSQSLPTTRTRGQEPRS